MSMMPRVLSAYVMVCLAASQAAPEQMSCTTPVDEATTLEQKQVQMHKSVNAEGLDGDKTSLLQVKQQVVKRANATDEIGTQDDGNGGFCVNDNLITAYKIKFRRYGANLVDLGCIGQKDAGWFYAGYRCREQMSLWARGAGQAMRTKGPTSFNQNYARKFASQVKAAKAGVEGSAAANGASSGTSSLQFLSEEFSSYMGLIKAFNANPDALQALKMNGADARLVTGVLSLSAESKQQLDSSIGGSVSATEATGTGSASAEGSSENSASTIMPKGQTLGYEISKPEWSKDGKTLVAFQQDGPCDFDDSWLGVCTC